MLVAGAGISSGVDGLWSRQTTVGLAPQGTTRTPAGWLNAEVGYGFAAFDTGLLTLYTGTVLVDGETWTYLVGARLHLTGRWAGDLKLTLEGRCQEPEGTLTSTQTNVSVVIEFMIELRI